jgi:hypothetical protein
VEGHTVVLVIVQIRVSFTRNEKYPFYPYLKSTTATPGATQVHLRDDTKPGGLWPPYCPKTPLKSREKYKNNKEDDEEDGKRVKLELGEELNPLRACSLPWDSIRPG